jgi:hypothetical protein
VYVRELRARSSVGLFHFLLLCDSGLVTRSGELVIRGFYGVAEQLGSEVRGIRQAEDQGMGTAGDCREERFRREV